MDGDGKSDLVVTNVSSDNVSVFRNTSISGSISASSFAAKVDFGTGLHPVTVAIGDLDGDSKPDLVIANQLSDNISVLRNTSTSGSISASSFSSKTDFPTDNQPVSVAVGDLDGDGIPELATTNINSNTVSVFQIAFLITCPADKTVNTDIGQCTAIVNDISPGTGASVNYTLTGATTGSGTGSATGKTFNKGTTTVAYTLTAYPAVSCSFMVMVVDNQKPVFPSLPDVVINTAVGQCYGNNILATPVVTDNCGVQSIINDAGATFPIGVAMVTWTATDVNSNVSTASQKVTVVDNQYPVITSCPVIPIQCFVANSIYNIPVLAATDNCGIQSINYVVTGATSRNGNGGNASGLFNPGTNTISWTVKDVNGNITTCSTLVKIDKVDVVIPDVYAANITSAIGKPNTIYIGYGGTSVTVSVQVTSSVFPNGQTSPNSYTYKWTVGSPGGTKIGTTATITVSPTATTTYFLSVKDSNNCATLYQVSKQINVINIVCASGKITVCVPDKKGIYSSSCVSSAASTINKLPAGWYLGPCTTVATVTSKAVEKEESLPDKFNVVVTPNPSNHSFSITVHSNNGIGKISVRVVDVLGRVLENRNSVTEGQTFRLGENYKPGIYLVEAIQGNERKTLKLIKQ